MNTEKTIVTQETTKSSKVHHSTETLFTELDPSIDSGYRLLFKIELPINFINDKEQTEKNEKIFLKFLEKVYFLNI